MTPDPDLLAPIAFESDDPKPRSRFLDDWEGSGYTFHCPGCGCSHAVRTEAPPGHRPLWVVSGSPTLPTLSPSVLSAPGDRRRRCHLFLRNGTIQYLADCGHRLAGRTVPMVPYSAPLTDEDAA